MTQQQPSQGHGSHYDDDQEYGCKAGYTKPHKTLLSWCLAMSAPTDDMALAN